MPIVTSKPCATCWKACYPIERVMVSDLWVHKHGCLKCSVCSTTLSLSSVYVAASPLPQAPSGQTERQLYCSKDVPRIVHTNVVDCLALRAAMNAPNPTTTPTGVFAPKGKGGNTRSIRFKGLTLRSRAIKAGLEAPKLNLRGLMGSQTIVGNAPGSPLNSWDIVHAMNVQSQVSSPIRDYPAIHAQRTGSSATQFPMPSQPLLPVLTGENPSEIVKAGKDEETMSIQPELVKNLIRVFQLDTVDQVELDCSAAEPLIDTCDASMIQIQSQSQSASIKNKSKKGDHSSLRTLATLGRSTRGFSTFGTAATVGNERLRPALASVFNTHHDGPVLGDSHISTENVSPASHPDITSLEEGRKAMALLNALLPLAAHLIPLPRGEDVDLHEKLDNLDIHNAREALALSLEAESLELVMLFEEEPETVCVKEAEVV